MKCPFCLATCLASDTKCLACNRSFEIVRVRARSAMWLCIPLFMIVGAGLFIGIWTPPPHFGSAGTNWTYVNQVALVALASALLGAVVGWILDYLARK
ncbi:MAG TPA: hypothetical protein VKD90_07665 [Gemmataceae bacterium]|nr:hypothetical protein [Gemmataceae bacterium]